jgi:cytochrome oxidase Cu insertion factor (SCO1/SenC/PrrC family)
VTKKSIVLITVASLLVAGLFAALMVLHFRGPGSVAQAGGPFELVDHTGVVRRDSEFRGSWMLVYFGYTFCPDLCPTALNDMTLAIEEMGARGKSVQPIFITVDVERDTPALLKDYVENFHPRMIALTGTEAQISAAARAYRIRYARVAVDDPEVGYQMDHNSYIYLMGPDGRYISHFNHNDGYEELAAALRAAMVR